MLRDWYGLGRDDVIGIENPGAARRGVSVDVGSGNRISGIVEVKGRCGFRHAVFRSCPNVQNEHAKMSQELRQQRADFGKLYGV